MRNGYVPTVQSAVHAGLLMCGFAFYFPLCVQSLYRADRMSSGLQDIYIAVLLYESFFKHDRNQWRYELKRFVERTLWVTALLCAHPLLWGNPRLWGSPGIPWEGKSSCLLCPYQGSDPDLRPLAAAGARTQLGQRVSQSLSLPPSLAVDSSVYVWTCFCDLFKNVSCINTELVRTLLVRG